MLAGQSWFTRARPIPLQSKSDIEFTVRINGKDVKLSNLSDETITRLKDLGV